MTKENYVHILIIFCVTFALSALIFSDGFPIGYDYKNQIIAYESASEQMYAGEIYPRWLADVNKGFGSTNLFFYPPFTYYTAYIIDAITGFKLSTGLILSFNASLLVFLSGLSFYIFSRGITTSAASCLMASLIYIMLPYHTWFEIYERNALAELSSYIWIPLIFHFISTKSLKSPKGFVSLSLSYAMLIVSHLPTAVFSSLFFGLYGALNAINMAQGKRLRYALNVMFCLVLGGCISAIYLYPAIALLEQTNAEYLWDGFYDYKNWFLWFNNNCPITDACTNLFLIASIQIVIPILFFTWLIINGKIPIITVQFFALSVICFFLMTPALSALWDILWPLQKIQFPWRLMVMSDFLFSAFLLTALNTIYKNSDQKRHSAYILIALSAILMSGLTITVAKYVKNSWAPPLHKFEESIANKMLTEEHIPKNKNLTLTYKELQQSNAYPLLSVVKGQAEIDLLLKMPRLIEIDVKANSNFTMQVRQFYFSGWHIIQNNTDITHTANLRDAIPYGQIEMDLPSGAYNLKIEMSMLLEEKIGAYISLISLTFLLLYIILNLYISHKKRKP